LEKEIMERPDRKKWPLPRVDAQVGSVAPRAQEKDESLREGRLGQHWQGVVLLVEIICSL
jgi:hypothetical protein